MVSDGLEEFRRRRDEIVPQIVRGSVWEDVETGERITVDDFDGAYAYGHSDRPGRFQNERRINWDHFGSTLRRVV